MKVTIVGAYPPPSGGNSVHIKRLHELLEEKAIDAVVLDPYNAADKSVDSQSVFRFGPIGVFALVTLIRKIRNAKSKILHIHVSAMGKFLFVGPLLLGMTPSATKTIITIHSGSFVNFYNSLSPLKKKLARYVLDGFNQIITVGNEQKSLLVDEGYAHRKIHVIPAYLPPKPEKFDAADEFLQRVKRENKQLIISSGYGIELYGYERIIQAMKINPALDDRYALLLCTYNTFDADYLAHLDEQLESISVSHVFRDLKAEEFAYLLKNADIYVRATDRDGDAVAIREANYFGLPVLASDVVKRPEFCHLFNRDKPTELAELLADDAVFSDTSAKNEGDSSFATIVNLYDSTSKDLNDE